MVSLTDFPLIQVEIEDVVKLKEALSILDSNKIREALYKIRQSLIEENILPQRLIPYEELEMWEGKQQTDFSDAYEHALHEVDEVLRQYSLVGKIDEDERVERGKRLRVACRIYPPFSLEIDLFILRRTFGLPRYFKQVLKSAVVCGQVREVDFQRAVFEIVSPSLNPTFFLDDAQLVLSFSPNMRKAELKLFVQDNFDAFLQDARKRVHASEVSGLRKPVFHFLQPRYTTEKEALIKARDYYWRHQEGVSFEDLAYEYASAKKDLDLDASGGIRGAITNYKNLLFSI